MIYSNGITNITYRRSQDTNHNNNFHDKMIHSEQYSHVVYMYSQSKRMLCLRMSSSIKCRWSGMSLTSDMSSEGERMRVGVKTTERL